MIAEIFLIKCTIIIRLALSQRLVTWSLKKSIYKKSAKLRDRDINVTVG